FGIASYLICTFFFVLGVNLFAGRKVFSLTRNLKYLVVGLPLISVAAAVMFASSNPAGGVGFPWGGNVGNICKSYLYNTIGRIGTVAVLIVALLSYIIWRFNPSFRLPKKANAVDAEGEDKTIPTSMLEEDAQPEAIGNVIKGNKDQIVNIPTTEEQDSGLSISEKEEEPAGIPVEKKVET